MGVKLKWGGSSWYTPGSGKIAVQWSDAWQFPTSAKVKVGPPGAGYWADSGYAGYPGTPGGFYIYSWSYGHVALAFSAPTSGAPVTAYQVVQTNEAGTWLAQVEIGGSPWGNFGVSQDTRYRFYVRAKGASGLYGPFAGPINVQIGHDTYISGYHTENRTQPWSTGMQPIDMWRDSWGVLYLPPNVAMDAMLFDLYATFSTSQLYSGSRQLYHVFYNSQFGDQVYWSNPTGLIGESFGLQGNGSYFGLIPRGTGWGTSSGSFGIRGNMALNGTETYQVTIADYAPATGNGYY